MNLFFLLHPFVYSSNTQRRDCSESWEDRLKNQGTDCAWFPRDVILGQCLCVPVCPAASGTSILFSFSLQLYIPPNKWKLVILGSRSRFHYTSSQNPLLKNQALFHQMAQLPPAEALWAHLRLWSAEQLKTTSPKKPQKIKLTTETLALTYRKNEKRDGEG